MRWIEPSIDLLGPGKDALTLIRRFQQIHCRSRCAARARRGQPACWLALALLLECGSAGGSEILLPRPRESTGISVRADHANRWTEGSYEVWMLRGDCRLVQDSLAVRGEQAVLWVRRAADSSGGSNVLAYFESGVAVQSGPRTAEGRPASTLQDRHWFGRLDTSSEIEIDAPLTGFQPEVAPPLYQRGLAAWGGDALGGVQPAQYAGQAPPPPAPATPDPNIWPPPMFPGGAAPSAGAVPPSAAVPPGSPRWTSPAPPALPDSGFAPGANSPAAPFVPPAGSSVTPGPMPAHEAIPAPAPDARPSARRILIRSRSSVRMQYQSFPSPDGRETIAVFTSGVNVVVEGIENVPGLGGDKIDIEADRIVVWTAPLEDLNLSGQAASQKLQPRDTPLEFYLEGNIVFREGDRVIYAERMYYNVQRRAGMVLNAEILTPAPGYQGLVRLKANVLQQMDEQNFQAYGAAVTSSRMGVPRYWFQSERVSFQDRQIARVDPFTGRAPIDPETGEAAIDHEYLATSSNNFVYLAGVPVLYWPVMATDLEKPSYYVDNLRIKSDDVFGFQVYPDLDVYQLLGIRNRPEGTRWSFSPDYLSDRGFALGTQVRYDRGDFLGIPGRARGMFDAWGIEDSGFDNLGLDRRVVVPEDEQRGRVSWQHRHELPAGFQLTGELGFVSDRNFLEQYYEREWDEGKDQTTGAELKQYLDSHTWSVSADARLNDFFTQTEWLPQADHFLLGVSLFDRFTWFAHSHIGYARLRTAELPPLGSEPPQDHLPWETDLAGVPYDERQGLRAATRQEIDLPFSLGPFRVVPYGLGELASWDEDRDGTQLERAYGQAGVRASLPFWSVDPGTQSTLLNLNGLAHKVTLDAEFFVADSTQDFNRLPLYDPLDDDATEHFRRRFLPDVYGGVLPPQFDERYFALRSGLQNWVTSPAPEIADDLMVAKAGIRQRWQTKRGFPGQERIVDWIVLDMEGSFFPQSERDNFGETAGLLNYDLRWHVGDRLTLLSDGFADLFDDGLRTVSVGGVISRPLRGSLYLGFRTIEGPIDSDRVTTTVNYRMSEKWILNAGASYDFSETGNLGETLSFTRIGESMLVRLGVNFDHSRDNVGLAFAIEPRFLSGKLSRVGGMPLPPVGAFGIE